MIGVIILAAGESGRLGQPKQNLIFQDKTLLQLSVETAFASVCEPIIVILGANEEVVRRTIDTYPIKILSNSDWSEGMASSIRLGVKEVQQIPGMSSVILMLCDQPFVSPDLLNELVHAGAKTGIAACVYNNTIGVPVLFDSKYFEELQSLTGDEGAKKLLLKYPNEVISIPFAMGGVDIDTVEDYERLNLPGI